MYGPARVFVFVKRWGVAKGPSLAKLSLVTRRAAHVVVSVGVLWRPVENTTNTSNNNNNNNSSRNNNNNNNHRYNLTEIEAALHK